VVDTLKELLSKVNWARAGLGLPMIEEPDSSQSRTSMANGVVAGSAAAASSKPYSHGAGSTNAYYEPNTQSIVAMDETSAYSRASDRSDLFAIPHSGYRSGVCASFKGFTASQMILSNETLLNVSQDHDQDKYKRRPAFQWFARWFSSRVGSGGRQRKDPNASCKRYVIISLLAFLALITMIIVFSKLGRAATEDDPALDPLANPNIKIESQDAI